MLEPTPGDPNTLSGGGGGGGGPPKGLVDRVKDILMSPKTEWDVIDGEAATIGGLFTGYVMILAAIPAIAMALGLIFFMPRPAAEIAAMGQAFGIPVITTGSIVVGCVVQYVMSLVGVYVMALIIDALAPSFGGTKDQCKAFQVAAYFPTAAWVAGILYIIPMLGLLVFIAAIYALYTLYLGLPKLMRVAADKTVGYFVVVLILYIVVFMVVGYIGSRVMYGGFI